MHNLFAFTCSFPLTLTLSFSLSLHSTLPGFFIKFLIIFFFNYLHVCISLRIACIFVPSPLTLDSLFFSRFLLLLLLLPLAPTQPLLCHTPLSYYCSMFLINKQRHITCWGQPHSLHPHGLAPSLRPSHAFLLPLAGQVKQQNCKLPRRIPN